MAQHAADDDTTFGSKRSSAKKKAKPLLHTFLHASPPTLLELANGLSDDIATLSRLGLIGKRTGERAAYYADWCWFLSTLVNLVENAVERNVILEQQHQGTHQILETLGVCLCAEALSCAILVESRLYKESMSGATAKSNPTANKLDEKELARLQRQDHWIVLSRWKLLMDLTFVCKSIHISMSDRPSLSLTSRRPKRTTCSD